MAYRIDAGELRPMRQDANGFLRGDAFVSKIGIFEYWRDGKIFRELRPPEEVFHPEALQSMEIAPITLGHPSTPTQLLTSPKDAEGRVVGAAASPTPYEQEKVKTSIVIHHADAIEAVERGVRQISPGYTADFDPTPGIWNGKPYDGVQRRIRYNHYAIVPMGRQGSDVGMRLDAADGISTQLVSSQEEKTMKVEIGSDTHDIPDALAAGIKASVDKLQGRVDAAEKLSASRVDSAQLPELVAKRLATVIEAREVLGDKIPLEKIVRADEDEILRAMCVSLDPTVKLDGMSTDYVRGTLGVLRGKKEERKVEAAAAKQGLVELARASSGNEGKVEGRTDADDKLQKETDAEYEKMMKRNADAWRTPVPT